MPLKGLDVKRFLIVVALLLIPSPSWAQDSPFDTLKAERAKFGPTVTADEVCTILARTVRGRADYGLLLKSGGAGCTLSDGRRVSGDTVIYAPQAPSAAGSEHFDVLYDWDGARIATPKWDSNGPCVVGPSSGCDMSRFTRIAASMVLPGDGATPPPPPANDGSLDALKQQVSALASEVQSLKAQLTQTSDRLDEASGELETASQAVERIDHYLADKPIPTKCAASLFGLPVGCKLQ